MAHKIRDLYYLRRQLHALTQIFLRYESFDGDFYPHYWYCMRRLRELGKRDLEWALTDLLTHYETKSKSSPHHVECKKAIFNYFFRVLGDDLLYPESFDIGTHHIAPNSWTD